MIENHVAVERGRLLRILGVGFGLAVIIGNTIGAGILRTPGEVAAQLPDVWLFLGVWLVGGIYALLGAFSISELGVMIPRSGGQYVFAQYALGDYAGFIVGWSDWLSTCGTAAAVSIVIGEYLTDLFPFFATAGEFLGNLIPFLSASNGVVIARVSIALAVVIVFAVLQWRGIRWGSATQNITSLFKALAFVALIAACFLLGGKTPSEAEPATIAAPDFFAVIIALQAVIYTYDGWTGVIYFSEEVRDPSRDIPRSMFGGVLAIMAIYMLVNIALVYVLPIWNIAGENLALGAAADEIFGAQGGAIIKSLTIISMLSAINAYHLMASRVLFAMSSDKLVSTKFASVNEGGTPTLALFASVMAAMIFILGGAFENSRRIFENIIAALAFFFVVNYLMSYVSVFALRRREPLRERPYRAWGYPVTTALTLVGSAAFLVGAVVSDIVNDQRNSLYALALLAASYPVYWLVKKSRQANTSE
ncbi:MAG: APC family permease [Acidobacteriota bacterium]